MRHTTAATLARVLVAAADRLAVSPHRLTDPAHAKETEAARAVAITVCCSAGCPLSDVAQAFGLRDRRDVDRIRAATTRRMLEDLDTLDTFTAILAAAIRPHQAQP